jgi:hypothetical protein
MGLFDNQTKELNAAIVALKEEIVDLRAEREAQAKQTSLFRDYTALRTELEDLKIDKGKIVEENDRKLRETTHMVGLERKRQEFEAEQAKKGIEAARQEAILNVREENLKAEREAFLKQMSFQEDRFKKEVGYLKDLMEKVLERLPTVTVDRQISDTTSVKRTT